MTKRLRLPGMGLPMEECTQCGASSGVSETLGESMATRLTPHLSVPVSVPAFPFLGFCVFLKTSLEKLQIRAGTGRES